LIELSTCSRWNEEPGGTEPPRRRYIILALLLIAAACRQAAPAARKGVPPPASGEPQIAATVVTIQTTVQPGNRTLSHTLVIANDRARSGDEVDRWRLFDLKANRVTYVDDVQKSYRSESVEAASQRRRAAWSQALPPGMPHAEVQTTRNQRTIAGLQAKQSIVRVGKYQRDLWIGTPQAIPAQLFAMMSATAGDPSPLSAISRAADEALLTIRGFPLTDHAELAYNDDPKQKLVIDRTVVKIEQRNVPQSWLALRADYKDATPKPPPAPAATR
jgi:hypothetical protein